MAPRRSSLALSSLLVTTQLLSGCASTTEKLDYSARAAKGGPAECLKLTEDDVDTNYGETVTVGAVLGAVGGTLLGVLAGAAAAAGGQDPAPLVIGGAAAGFALGAGIGAADGVETADKKEAYALQEAQLDCQIEALKDDNQEMSKIVLAMKESTKATEAQLRELEAEYVAKRKSKGDVEKELAEIDENSKQIERSISAMKAKRDTYIAARTKTQDAAEGNLNTKELDQQIDACSRKIDESEKLLKTLLEHRQVAVFL
jgi:hypothetical protein